MKAGDSSLAHISMLANDIMLSIKSARKYIDELKKIYSLKDSILLTQYLRMGIAQQNGFLAVSVKKFIREGT